MRPSCHAVQRCSEECLGASRQRSVAQVVCGAFPGPWLQASTRQRAAGRSPTVCRLYRQPVYVRQQVAKTQQQTRVRLIAQLAHVLVYERARKRAHSRTVLDRQRPRSSQHPRRSAAGPPSLTVARPHARAALPTATRFSWRPASSAQPATGSTAIRNQPADGSQPGPAAAPISPTLQLAARHGRATDTLPPVLLFQWPVLPESLPGPPGAAGDALAPAP